MLTELEILPALPTDAATFDAVQRLTPAHQSVARSLPLLRAASARMLTDGGCVACHFSRTALAIRALTVYATPAPAREYKQRAIRAAAWLAAQKPLSTEDRVMQLLGL